MTRNHSANLITALDQNPNSPGFLLSITPVGLDPVYLNTFRADFTYAGDVYLGSPGFLFNGARFTDKGESSMEITVPLLEAGPVTPDDVTRGFYAGAEVVVRVLDFDSGDVSEPLGFKWSIGRIEITNDGQAVFDLRDAWRIQRELLLTTIGPGCKTFLGSDRCGVDVLGLWTDSVTVASWISSTSFTISGARGAAVDDFYARGAIRFESGPLIGRSFTVRSWVQSTSTVRIWEPLPAQLGIGDTALIHAGCNLKRGAGGCLKFSNNRYQGFDHLPADDAKFSFTPPPVAVPTVTNTTTTVVNRTEVKVKKVYNWSTGRYVAK